VALCRCQSLLQNQPDVLHSMTLTENPFDLFGGGPCVLVCLSPAEKRKTSRSEAARAVRTRLDEVGTLTLRLRDLSSPGESPFGGYPLDLAVVGPEAGSVRDFARKLDERLAGCKALTDVRMDPASTPRPQLSIDVDRTKAATLGVRVKDVFSTLEVYSGPVTVNEARRFGRIARVEIQAAGRSADWVKDLRQLKVRNARGEMVPLGALVSIREIEGPAALDFFDFLPKGEITANPGSGVTLEQARAACEALAEDVRQGLHLRAEYRIIWLQDLPRSK
jgi:multidrug efflux pump subunit AcrB